jgi:hypothetical protein
VIVRHQPYQGPDPGPNVRQNWDYLHSAVLSSSDFNGLTSALSTNPIPDGPGVLFVASSAPNVALTSTNLVYTLGQATTSAPDDLLVAATIHAPVLSTFSTDFTSFEPLGVTSSGMVVVTSATAAATIFVDMVDPDPGGIGVGPVTTSAPVAVATLAAFPTASGQKVSLWAGGMVSVFPKSTMEYTIWSGSLSTGARLAALDIANLVSALGTTGELRSPLSLIALDTTSTGDVKDYLLAAQFFTTQAFTPFVVSPRLMAMRV